MTNSGRDNDAAASLAALYRPDHQGTIRVYEGPLTVEGTESATPGSLEIETAPRSQLLARFEDFEATFPIRGDNNAVTIPSWASLDPPTPRGPSEEAGGPVYSRPIHSGRLTAGRLERAERLVFHFLGPLKTFIARHRGQAATQFDFKLRDWTLRLARTDASLGDQQALVIVEATSPSRPTFDDVSDLGHDLFVLLSFVAAYEVGPFATAGVGAGGHIVWAQWGAPRLRAGKAGVTWCPSQRIPEALPELAEGLSALADDQAMTQVVRRAVQIYLAAGVGEVLDLRIPVCCIGLELVAWAILQRHGVTGSGKAAPMTRAALEWAGVPTEIPTAFDALRHRAKLQLPADRQDGPGVLFNIRNRLIHPPKSTDQPAWPDGPQLLQAWQLTTWYLELLLLRVLGYGGRYFSRLRLGRYEGEDEPVPWAGQASS